MRPGPQRGLAVERSDAKANLLFGAFVFARFFSAGGGLAPPPAGRTNHRSSPALLVSVAPFLYVTSVTSVPSVA